MSFYGKILGGLLIAERNVKELCLSFTADSRRVVPGCGFAAVPGTAVDGHDFIPAALEKGASLIVMEREIPLPQGTPHLIVKESAAALALLVRHAAGNPDEALALLGVTGTNGKTTTAFVLEHIFRHAKFPCGLVSTVEYRTGKEIIPGDRTTPDPVTLFSFFRDMKENGLTHAAMELSSHALVQNRAAGIQLRAGIFTNLTGDHLDYHGTMENYYQAKKRLFTHFLHPDGAAVINADDPWGERLFHELEGRKNLFAFSAAGKGNCLLSSCQLKSCGVEFSLEHPCFGELHISSNLAGEYNIRNLAGAVLGALACGIAPEAVLGSLTHPVHVPGRLESFQIPGGGTAFVDYAHTDDALTNVLNAVRRITPGKVSVLFGAGGDRDRTKRPRMGAAAAQGADMLFVTSDNPRSEDPDAIISEILSGVPDGKALRVIPDRKEAILAALARLKRNDALLVAGKGHEAYQEIKGKKYHFSDREIIEGFIRGKES